MPLRIAPLPASADAAALTLLDRTFADDPTLAWYLRAGQPGQAERRRDYLALYLAFHRRNGFPVLGAWQDDSLLGVCLFTPAVEPDHESLARLGQSIAERCGAESLARLDQLLAAFHGLLPHCARIEFLAVGPAHQGQGIGSALLATTLEQLEQALPGIALETGQTANLGLYQRFGFHLHQKLTLPGLTQYLLFRRCSWGSAAHA